MKKVFLSLLFLLLLLTSTVAYSSEIKIIEQTERYITIQVDFTNYNIITTKNYTLIKAADWEFNGEFNAPKLPKSILKVIVPPNGDARIEILKQHYKTVMISKPVLPVLSPVSAGKTHDFIPIIDKKKYQDFSKSPITKEKKARFRYYTYSPVVITPVIFGNSKNALKIYDKITFKIILIGNTNIKNHFKDKLSDVSDKIFINYEKAKYLQSKPAIKNLKPDFSASQFWYKFYVNNFSENKIENKSLKILPPFADLKTIRIFKSYKDKENNYKLKEIALYLKNGDIYFKNKLDSDRKNRGSTVFFLTFGGTFKNKPKRLSSFVIEKTPNKVTNLKEVKINRFRTEQADCIIVYPSVFYGIANDLAEFQTTTLKVKTVLAKQEDIINQYGGGYADYTAIRDFIADAFINWEEPAPEYVILLGSGTKEGLIGFNDITLEEWYSITDKNKVLTDGNGTDDSFVIFNTNYREPQLSISRFPFKTAQQFDIYMGRMEKYCTDLPSGWWQNKMTILADDELHEGGYEGMGNSSTFNHTYYAQLTQDNLKNTFEVDKITAINYPLDEYNSKPKATEELLKRINEGRLIWYYIGHGNNDVMGDESYFVSSDIERLYNLDYLPLLLAGSCNIGEFDNLNFDSIGDKILCGENGGAIASLTASRGCSPQPNYDFLLKVLQSLVNNFKNIGKSTLIGKLTCSNYSNSKKFNLLGSPLLFINPPKEKGNMEFVPNTLNFVNKRQTINIIGSFFSSEDFYSGELKIFDSPLWTNYTNSNYVINDTIIFSVDYTLDARQIYKGYVNLDDKNSFSQTFIVPDDAGVGNKAKMLCYTYNQDTNNRILSVMSEYTINDSTENVESSDKPQITLWLDSERFKPGDTVSSSPTIYARIFDENGINITGVSGRKILLYMKTPEGSENLIDMTNAFEYEENSYTTGNLIYKLNNLKEGIYNASLFAYDNFGEWNQEDTYFKVKKTNKIAIYSVLPYPNPMGKSGGKFTFLLSEDADVTLKIYTITGKKIITLKKAGCTANYNEINWNGKDADFDELANGTYFFKIYAKSIVNGKTTESIGKFVIEK